MRILVDVPEPDLDLLDRISKRLAISRAELIRRAIHASLTPYRERMDNTAYGIWAAHPEDGLDYQERLRAEW